MRRLKPSRRYGQKTLCLDTYINELRVSRFEYITSGMSTNNPVPPRVPTARATQKYIIRWNPRDFMHGLKNTPMLDINTMTEAEPIPRPQAEIKDSL